MKRFYLVASAMLCGTIALGQNQHQSSMTSVYSAEAAAKSGDFSPRTTPTASNRAVHFSEEFESGTFPPAGWTVMNGGTSTVTVPIQEWHENTGAGNPGNCASVLYDNSNDIHDEWIMTPAIVLPSGALRLEFQISTSQFWHVDPNDNADIVCYLSTAGNSISDLMAGDTVFWEQDPAYVNEWETYVWYSHQFDLSAYAGQTIYLGWHYLGQDGAQFNLDNISIYDIEPNDLAVTRQWNTDITADYEYGIYNFSQNRPVAVTLDIRNNGGAAQTNVGFNYEIVDDQFGTVVNSGSSSADIASLAPGETQTITYNTGFLTPGTAGSQYTVYTWPYADSTDSNAANDTMSRAYSITEHTWARDNGTFIDDISNISGGTGSPFRIGNTYLVTEFENVTGLEIGIGSASPVGEIVYGEIYIYDGTDYQWVSTTVEHTVSNSDLGEVIFLEWDNGSNVPLNIGDDVLVVAGHYGGANDGSNDVEIATSWDGLEGTVLGFDGSNTPFQLLSPDVPIVRISDFNISISEESEKGIRLEQNQPNPTSGNTMITYELPSAAQVSVEIVDLTGKQVMLVNEGNMAAGIHQLELDITGLANGMYYYSLRVENVVLTRKLVLER